MSNIIQRLKYVNINSSLIRKLLSFYYKEGKIYRIPFGPLRNLKMRYDRSINFHAILGLWELQNFELLSRVFIKGGLLKNAMVVCDVGANIGIYSLWFSRYLSTKGIVYAFEPSPHIVNRLKENLSMNGSTNVVVIESACSDKVGNVEFFVGSHHHTSSLCAEYTGRGQIALERKVINATTLDDFFYGIERYEGPDVIKMDIEGGGIFALKGCDKCIINKRPVILIESHTPAEDLAISELIVHHDYQAYRLNNRQWVEVLTETFPNPKGVWGTLFLCPVELRKRLSKIVN